MGDISKALVDKKKQRQNTDTAATDEDISFPPVKQEMKMIPLTELSDEAWNSRMTIDESSQEFKELEGSIRQNGLKQNIVVTPLYKPDKKGRKYEIVSGFRRFRALTRIGTRQVMCMVETYAHPAQRIVANIIENTHRARLKPYELAMACLELKKIGNYKTRQIAKMVNYSEPHIGGLLSCVQNLIPQFQDMFRNNSEQIPISQLFVTARMNAEEQLQEYNRLINKQAAPPSGSAEPKGRDPDTGPKMKKRDALIGAIGDLSRGAESVIVRGEESFIRDDEERQKIITMLRWAIGELKKYPLVMPPDDIEKEGGGRKR